MGVIFLGSGPQTRYLGRRTRKGERKGGGGKKKRERERREEERRRAKKKKMSRESEDHASRSLGKLVDSPSSFERRKRLLRLKKKLKVEKRSILRRFNRWT